MKYMKGSVAIGGRGRRCRARGLLAVIFAAWLVTAGTLHAQDVVGLEAYLGAVEQAHPSLRSASFEADLAEAEIRNALGRFDPMLDVHYTHKDKDGTEKLGLLEGSLELPLDMMFGPKLKATYRRGTGTHVNPESVTGMNGEAGIGIALPLFQGIFTDARRNQLRKASLRPDLAAAQYRVERNALLRSAALRYWDWSEAVAAVGVADSVYRLVRERATMTANRARAGEISAIDTVEILQEVARRQGELFRAQRIAEQAEVDAGVYLWAGDGSPRTIGGRPQELPLVADTSVLARISVENARAVRPEMRRIDVLQQTARLDSGLASEYMRPFVELEGALLAYDPGVKFSPDVKLGLTISQPLFFRSASARTQVASVAVQRADLQRALVERLVDADVANAVISVRRSRDRMEIAAEEVRLAQLMLVAERRRFEAGESTLLTLNLRERFYAEALLRHVSARADWSRALVAMAWAAGTI